MICPPKRATSVAVKAVIALLATAAVAQERSFHFDIASQPLSQALKTFGQVSGLEIIFTEEVVAGRDAGALKGEYTTEAAIERLLSGTGLIAERSPAGALMIRPAATKKTTTSRDSGDDVEEIMVTAKKPFMDRNVDIVRTANDAQPYYILNNAAIEQSGAANVEDYLKQKLTMNAMPLANSQYATYGQGNISSINLRGLGSNQTLILINGRRTSVSNFTGTANQPDVNSIPLAAVDRIEVLPSSSAAIYGGSAVGGVVNIILKHNYDGAQIKATYENTFETDAAIRKIDLAYGFNFEEGRTNVLLTGSYSDADPMLRGDRPQIARKGIETVLRNYPALLYSNASPFNAGATTNIASANGSPLIFRDGTPLGSSYTNVPANIAPDSPLASLNAGLLANAGSYNLNLPDTSNYYTGSRFYMGSAPTVKSFQASIRRKMTEHIEAFVEFSMGRNSAESGFNSLFTLPVPASSPVNPFQQNLTITMPDPYSAPYYAEIDNRRATVGATMDLPHDWRLQTDYTWNYTEVTFGSTNANTARLNTALATGAINPFVNTQLYPLNLAPYLGRYEYNAPAELNDVGLRAAGPLWHMPAGQPLLAIGLEHRKEGFERGTQWFRYAGFPEDDSDRVILDQEQNTDSIYAELKVPFYSPLNAIPGVRLLDVQIAARMERYSVTTGPTQYYLRGTPAQLATNVPLTKTEIDYSSTNPTIGVRYKPVESLMLRASYGTAFLPPGYTQLAAPIDNPNAAATVLDPLRGNALTNIHPQYGGNPSIKPQESKNWNVGLVFEPDFLEGARLTLEWYRLEQDNVVITPTAQQVVNLESQFPGRVTRAAPAPGETVGAITDVDATLINANEGKTDGFDLTLEYRKRTDLGTFAFFAMATRVGHYWIQNGVGAPLEDIVNELGRGGPAKFKANASISWTLDNVSAGWAMRHFGSYEQYDLGTQAYVLAQGSDRIPSQSYHDLFASYRFEDYDGGRGSSLLNGTEVQFGIKNVFNKVPPFDAYYGVQGYYYSPLGDPRLRSYWVSIAKNF